MQDLSLLSAKTISPTLNRISIMFRWSLAESAGHFWWPAEFENMANLYLKNIKHFKNPGHLLLTAPSNIDNLSIPNIDIIFLSIPHVDKLSI